ncbi:LIM and SH3 domain protein Lasp isoform X3 [Zeugodacus cucurbitae]|nr:LIM and SH3 domain protein Lasp isoform X3 [Zeugodacus cucurbitae]
MNKTCARCQKVVYPIEELKCLDKTWHKTCFKCTECGMALNMKTYKGFNKLPYCEAHIPKAKATVIADTPELKRIAENTKIQSNVKYHEDFEKSKGKFTQVADDPETLRIKQNTKIISNIAYHGDLEKKAAMEKQREAAEIADVRAAANHAQQQQQQQQPSNTYNQLRSAILHNSHHPTGGAQPAHLNENVASAGGGGGGYGSGTNSATYDQYDNYTTAASVNSNSNSNNNHLNYQQQQQQQQPQKTASYHSNTNAVSAANANNGAITGTGHPTGGPQATQQLYASNNYNSHFSSSTSLGGAPGGAPGGLAHHNSNGAVSTGVAIGGGSNSNHSHPGVGNNSGLVNVNNGSATAGAVNSIGKIADYDPLTDGPRPMPNTGRPSTTLIYSSDSRGSVNNAYPKRIGSIADIDPANGIYSSLASDSASHHQQQSQQHHQQQQQQQQLLHQQQQQQQRALQQQQQQQQQQQYYQQMMQQQQQSKPNLRVYRALYDYEAQDTDEVSFREGDVIFEVESADSGWMTGRVERTGKTGMLPANYVEQAVI